MASALLTGLLSSALGQRAIGTVKDFASDIAKDVLAGKSVTSALGRAGKRFVGRVIPGSSTSLGKRQVANLRPVMKPRRGIDARTRKRIPKEAIDVSEFPTSRIKSRIRITEGPFGRRTKKKRVIKGRPRRAAKKPARKAITKKVVVRGRPRRKVVSRPVKRKPVRRKKKAKREPGRVTKRKFKLELV